LLESTALGTEVEVAFTPALFSAALTGADSSIAHAVASAVKVAILGDLVDLLLASID